MRLTEKRFHRVNPDQMLVHWPLIIVLLKCQVRKSSHRKYFMKTSTLYMSTKYQKLRVCIATLCFSSTYFFQAFMIFRKTLKYYNKISEIKNKT